MLDHAPVDGTRRFLVARNPDDASKLPFLLSLPLPGGPVLLKARETWPRTARVYCHPADEWPGAAEVVDEVAVRECRKRGRAIDLVLDRPRDNRSQFVFANIQGGREAIFWQTAKTTKGLRPGVRIPGRRASAWEVVPIVVDSRERYAYTFGKQQATVDRAPLEAGDYAVLFDGAVAGVVERKSVAGLTKDLIDGSLAFAMADLAALAHAAVIVDGPYAELLKNERVRPGFVLDLLARVQVRYPNVPIVFAGTRALAEEWTFRFLGAARAEAAGDARYGNSDSGTST